MPEKAYQVVTICVGCKEHSNHSKRKFFSVPFFGISGEGVRQGFCARCAYKVVATAEKKYEEGYLLEPLGNMVRVGNQAIAEDAEAARVQGEAILAQMKDEQNKPKPTTRIFR